MITYACRKTPFCSVPSFAISQLQTWRGAVAVRLGVGMCAGPLSLERDEHVGDVQPALELGVALEELCVESLSLSALRFRPAFLAVRPVAP